MRDLNIALCVIIFAILLLTLTFKLQRDYYQRDLREQEEVYTIELNRLSKICKDNKKSVQAPEHRPVKRW